MSNTKVLDLIPESLRADLIEEVKTLINSPNNPEKGKIDLGLKAYLEKQNAEAKAAAEKTPSGYITNTY